MSTRYVWGRFLIVSTWTKQLSSISGAYVIGTPRAGAGYSFDSANGTFSLTGSQTIITEGDTQANPYQYFLFTNNNRNLYEVPDYYKDDCYWTILNSNNSISLLMYPYGTHINFNKYEATQVSNKGEQNGYVSSKVNSTYPQDAVSGSYWYTYQGSDNIDPSAVSIPSSIMGGSQISISVTAGTGKVYDGTVQYQYEVKLDDGSWTSIGTSTATSYSYTVPAGTNTFQARVRAQDNIGFVSDTYVSSSSTTVTNNIAPTAPTSISATNTVKNQTATVTWNAGTDSDGTITSYTVQRKINGGSFATIYTGSALTTTDSIGDWSTVQYQVQCTDDDGATSGWTQSENYTVQSGQIVITGPTYEMGEKPKPFQFQFTLSISGVSTSVTDVTTTVTLDGTQVYSSTPDVGDTITLGIDTRFLSSGTHTLIVSANKTNYVSATGTYTFVVPVIELDDGGVIQQFQNENGENIFPVTLARCVVTEEGQDVVSLITQTLQLMNAMLGVD